MQDEQAINCAYIPHLAFDNAILLLSHRADTAHYTCTRMSLTVECAHQRDVRMRRDEADAIIEVTHL